MRNLKLTKNFKLFEFTGEGKNQVIVRNTSFQLWLINKIANDIMQPIRDEFGPIKITSGIRDCKNWCRLDKAGYKPSKTTDHSYGIPEVNQFGVGACDFLPYKKWDYWVIYNFIRKNLNFGQVIIYLSDEKDNYRPRFIHVSNPYELVYGKKMVEYKFLTKIPELIQQGNKYHLYNREIFEKFSG